MNNSSQCYVGTRDPLQQTQNTHRHTFSDGAESCLSAMVNYEQEVGEDMKPNKQSQQAAEEETDEHRAQAAAL